MRYDLGDGRPVIGGHLGGGERLRSAMRTAQMYVWDSDIVAGVTHWGESAADVLGLDQAQLPTAMGLSEFFVAESDRKALIDGLARAVHERATSHQAEFRSWDGRYFRTSCAIGYDEKGHATTIHGVTQDITERQMVTQAIRDSELRLRSVLDGMAESFALLDRDFRILMINRQALELDGRPAEELLGRTHWEAFPGTEEREVGKLYKKVMAERTPGELEHQYTWYDGRITWLHLRVYPVGEDLIALFWRDITEQHETAEQLRLGEQRYRAVFEQAGVGVARVSPDGPFLEINDRYCAILKRSRADLIGGAWADITHPDDLDADLANVQRLLAGEIDNFTMEKRYVGPEGEDIWVNLTVALVRDTQGLPSFFIAVAEDINARKAAEREVAEFARLLEARVEERTSALVETARALELEMAQREEMQSQLLQAQKMEALGKLVGGVAQDFNNILAAIQGAFMLLGQRVTDEDEKLVVAEGRKATDRAAGLIRQMLAFARHESIKPKSVDLADMLPDLRDLLCHAAGPLIDCRITVAPGTAPVLIDPQQLEVALLNLTINARDAMPAGGVLEVTAGNVAPDAPRPAALGSGDAVLIAVRNNGIGMDEATAKRALEPFFTTKGVGQGTGLGLAQVHGLVSRASGVLTIDSAPGEGTTVSLYLPRAAVAAEPLARTPAAPIPRGNATVLLVDDDHQVRPVTAAYLRELGYAVVEAASASVAVAMVELNPIDILITDVVMPDIDGPTLVARLRKLRPDLPVVFVTGFAGDSPLEGELVVAKPFTGEELSAAIVSALSARVEPAV